MTKSTECPEGICDGSGFIEAVEMERNDSTGYNLLVMETGLMERCPCNLQEHGEN